MTVGQLLASISSRELTEWAQYFEWKAERDEAEREFRQKAAEADRWVRDGR